jgi:hypothetical protein
MVVSAHLSTSPLTSGETSFHDDINMHQDVRRGGLRGGTLLKDKPMWSRWLIETVIRTPKIAFVVSIIGRKEMKVGD